MAEYVARHDPVAATAAMDRVAAELDTSADAFIAAAAYARLRATEW